MDNVFSLEQPSNLDPEADLGDGDKCHGTTLSNSLHATEFPQVVTSDQGENDQSVQKLGAISPCDLNYDNDENRATYNEANGGNVNVAGINSEIILECLHKDFSFKEPSPSDSNDIIGEIFSNTTITEHNLFQAKLQFLPTRIDKLCLEKKLGKEDAEGLHQSTLQTDFGDQSTCENETEKSDFWLCEDDVYVLLSPRKHWNDLNEVETFLSTKEARGDSKDSDAVWISPHAKNANGDELSKTNGSYCKNNHLLLEILSPTTPTSSASVKKNSDKNFNPATIVSTSDGNLLQNNNANKIGIAPKTKSTKSSPLEIKKIIKGNYEILDGLRDSSKSLQPNPKSLEDFSEDDEFYSEAPQEFNVDMSSEDDSETPGPSHRHKDENKFNTLDRSTTKEKEVQLVQEQNHTNEEEEDEGEEETSMLSSIYHPAHTESFMSDPPVSDLDDEDDDEVMSRCPSAISGIAQDRQPLERELNKCRGMKVVLQLSEDFDGERDDLETGEVVEVDVVWANQRYFKADENSDKKEIIIPPKTFVRSHADTPHEENTSHIQSVKLKKKKGRRRIKVESKLSKTDNNDDENIQVDDGSKVHEMGEAELDAQARMSPTIKNVSEQKKVIVGSQKDDSTDENSDVHETDDENCEDKDDEDNDDVEADAEDDENQAQVSDESFSVNFVPNSNSGILSTTSSSVEVTTDSDTDGDESVYDVEFMGRWDIFWPLMTKSQRKMVGAPEDIDMYTRSFIKHPEESDEEEDNEEGDSRRKPKISQASPIFQSSSGNNGVSVEIQEIIDDACQVAGTDVCKEKVDIAEQEQAEEGSTVAETRSSSTPVEIIQPDDGLGENDEKLETRQLLSHCLRSAMHYNNMTS